VSSQTRRDHKALGPDSFVLRARVVLIVLLTIGGLTAIMSVQSIRALTTAYHDAGRSELRAVASTWDDGFRLVDVRDPARLQRRMARVKRNNPNLHKIAMSWRDRAGNAFVVAVGHEHGPGGEKRDVTSRAGGYVLPNGRRVAQGVRVQRHFRDIRAGGAHYLELVQPIERPGRGLVAALEVHYDLKALDQAKTAARDRLLLAGAGVATVLALLLNLLLGRAVVNPLQGVALRDPLTGLLNHRAFQERLGEELRRAERERYPVSLVAIDLDDFKAINDGLGHGCGDDALRHVAAALRAEVRPSDPCGRLGGDEFAVLLPRASSEEAEEIVERMRARISDAAVLPGGALTISAGIAEFPRHTLGQDELLHLADGAMYWAKTSGRDRVVTYSADSGLALSPEEAAQAAVRKSLMTTVHALAKAVDAKDGYTHSHSQRVARYAAVLAARLGLPEEEVERVRTAGVLHDVGKIGIPDAVLLKAGRLDEGQVLLMQRHSELGRDIIAGAGLAEIAEWVLHLHERYDGGGYPHGLAGDEIPLESRILHAADAFEAMTSSRVYRRALGVEVAMEQLERHAGCQFDPIVARALLALVREGELGAATDAGEAVAA